MIKGKFPNDKFEQLETPFYYYDMELLRKTLIAITKETENKPFHVHYALKANFNPIILKEIASFGFGADCVSGNEILRAIECGFDPSKIAFAGVGKTDKEINIGLDNNIFCFNVESIPEIEVINKLAEKKGKIASVALRINPNVDARTHKYITTGLYENKFGINEQDLPNTIQTVKSSPNIKLIGIHFHIGSQITDLTSFEDLCVKVKSIRNWFKHEGINLPVLNVGGGLGINYQHPNHFPMAVSFMIRSQPGVRCEISRIPIPVLSKLRIASIADSTAGLGSTQGPALKLYFSIDCYFKNYIQNSVCHSSS
jgi:diaminopimelate decarboxylase